MQTNAFWPARADWKVLSGVLGLALPLGLGLATGAVAQDRLPWQTDEPRTYEAPDRSRASGARNDAYAQGPAEAARGGWRDEPVYRPAPEPEPRYEAPPPRGRQTDAYRAPSQPGYESPRRGSDDDGPRPRDTYAGRPAYGEPYRAPAPDARDYERPDREQPLPPEYYERRGDGTFSVGEIRDVGHRFFGTVSQGMAGVIEYAFKRGGRPNGYIIGEDAGGAFIAGLRYGEGTLYTKDAGNYKVYWQGPSIGYDAGAEGSRVMVLVYNLRDPNEIYNRFGGVAGSAYVIGGVGLTFQKNQEVVLAPIRAGVGLRLGANVGYLKYTRRATWNPF